MMATNLLLITSHPACILSSIPCSLEHWWHDAVISYASGPQRIASLTRVRTKRRRQRHGSELCPSNWSVLPESMQTETKSTKITLHIDQSLGRNVSYDPIQNYAGVLIYVTVEQSFGISGHDGKRKFWHIPCSDPELIMLIDM